MSVKRGQIYCQRCLAANPVEKENCERCGTRLMLVVEPASQRFEDESVAEYDYEQHLLERITVLESHLTRFAEKLEKTLDLLLRQAHSSYLDHTLLESLIAMLAEAGAVKRSELIAVWRKASEREQSGSPPSAVLAGGLCEKVLAHKCDITDRSLFVELVQDGFKQVGEGDETEGVRKLENAAALAPTNAPLHAHIGQHFFREDKMALARDYLTRALHADPEDGRVRLLLGLACGDEGDTPRAKELLTESVERGTPSFAAHYALGRLLAAESDWASALEHFKLALHARECPEAHYVLGLVYFQLERYRTALRHLTKAVKTAPDYDEAFYLLGLVRLRLGQKEQACEAFNAAQALDRKEPRYRAAKLAVAQRDAILPPPTFISKGRGKHGLVTGGDHRLAAAVRDDALGGSLAR